MADVRAVVLVQGAAGAGKLTAVSRAATTIGAHLVPVSCEELRSASDQKTAAALKSAFDTAAEYGPAVLLLQNIPALLEMQNPTGSNANSAIRIASVLQDCLDTPVSNDQMVFVIGTADSASDVATPLRRMFTHELTAEAPDLHQRERMLQKLLEQSSNNSPEELKGLALKTAGLLPADIQGIVADAGAKAIARTVDIDAFCNLGLSESSQSISASPEIVELSIEEDDLQSALENSKSRTATALGAPQIPNVRWEDVGGLENIKQTILETVELPLRHPELFASGLRRRSGLLLYGPPGGLHQKGLYTISKPYLQERMPYPYFKGPLLSTKLLNGRGVSIFDIAGTGKTLIAKAVATECSINFLSVKGPELINMYVGESERQVREVFERARRARPCVLFFDELDSLAPARGAGVDSGGVMDRVVSQLLAEVDGLQGAAGAVASGSKLASQDIFLIGATNRPDLLDASLMRPGRLDKLLYVGIAQGAEDKLKVLGALTRKFSLSEDVDLASIAKACTPNLTGADLYALCADAWMAGLRRLTRTHKGDPNELEEVWVTQQDFQSSLRSLTPSLSQDELARYAALQEKYEGSRG